MGLKLQLLLFFVQLTAFHAETSLETMESRIKDMERDLMIIKSMLMRSSPRKSCDFLKTSGKNESGVYSLYPSEKIVKGYCEFNDSATGNNWLVIQRRIDGKVDFFRPWEDYKDGFGDLETEFWFGLDNIHYITTTNDHILRVEWEDFDGEKAYAQYSFFSVGDESSNYALDVGGFSGDGGDSLTYHNGLPFSTYDRDNDNWNANCAMGRHGAWWYNRCCYVNLNGKYHHEKTSLVTSILWYHWKFEIVSLKKTEMKIRIK